ncbi:MAG: NADH dehydrogenase subunit 5, partial [Bacilli bacterium]
MFGFLQSTDWMMLFVVVLALSCVSGSIVLVSKARAPFVRAQIWMATLPPVVALLALLGDLPNGGTSLFWQPDGLGWLMAFFVLFLGLVIQRFSVRYFVGNKAYPKYFILFTLTTAFASLTWLSGDLRLIALFWGA